MIAGLHLHDGRAFRWCCLLPDPAKPKNGPDLAIGAT